MSDKAKVDLSELSAAEARVRLGELVELCFRRSRACVFVVKKTGEFTVLEPSILDAIPDEDMAAALLGSWTDDEILQYLQDRALRQRSRESHG